MKKSLTFCGIDLSLNHGAAVLLRDDTIIDFAYVTDHKGASQKSKSNGIHLDFPKSDKMKDRQQRQLSRLLAARNVWLRILEAWRPDFLGIEDYALRAEGHAYHIGELGGVVRLLALDAGIENIRLHDPLSVKMFAAHNGTADKDEMVECVRKRWSVDFSKYNKSEADRVIEEDLSDAFAIAKLVRLEQQIRTGNVAMSSLHEKEIQTFNRMTKSYPVNLLGREWLNGKTFQS